MKEGLSVRSILDSPRIFDLFSRFLVKKSARAGLVRTYVRPFPGCRILDLGCGTAGILAHLPGDIGVYTGLDGDPSYIEYARKRWRNRPACGFFHRRIEDAAPLLERKYFDIVLALGVLHHLDDCHASSLVDLARRSLKPGGNLITYDNAYVENQHRFARWLISKDRGAHIRTPAQYQAFLERRFLRVETAIHRDFLRLPYTVCILRCFS